MEKLVLPFFEGIVLVVERAKPQQNIALLYRDAQELTQVCTRKGLSWQIESLGIVGTEISDTWLKHRQRQPSGKLGAEVIQVVERPRKQGGKAKAKHRFLHLKQAANIIYDEQFIQIFAGAQVALQRFKPQIPEEILSEDWDVIRQVYAQAVARYTSNGVPAEGVPVLVTQEFIDFRLSNPSKVLFGVRGLFGQERYGWLEVYTEPPVAKISVDKIEWGESPAKKGVPSGEHHIKAEKGQLSAQDNVEVKPAGFKRVDLRLA